MRSISCTSVQAAAMAMAAVSFCALQAAAATIHVPVDYPTIQQAIDAASDGDEIVVAPGTYFENINLLGKAVHLRSAEGPEVTTLDGDGGAPIITCDSGEGPETIIQGLTFRRSPSGVPGTIPPAMKNIGTTPVVIDCRFIGAVPWADAGWGMHNEGGGPTVIDSTISMEGDNDSGGGGMRNINATVVVSGCTFSNNTNAGGASAMWNTDSIVTITKSTFTNNHGHTRSAAIIHQGGTLEVSDSLFIQNSSDFTGVGAAISAGTSPSPTTVTVSGCTFDSNWGSEDGPGAIGAGQGTTWIIIGSTFLNNKGGPAGAVRLTDGSEVHDCIFIGNESFWSAGAVLVDGSALIANSTFVNNIGATWKMGEGGEAVRTWIGGGPQISGSTFCGNSPGHLADSWTNLGGNQFGEFCPVGDLDGNGVVNIFDLLAVLAAWGPCADPTPGNCPADLDGNGIVDIFDLLIVLANWGS